MKSNRKSLTAAAIVAPLILVTACGGDSGGDSAAAEDFPEDSVTIITAFAAGGANDSLARILAEHTENLFEDYNFVIENVEGGGGSVGQAQGASAEADGYTLTLITPSVVSNPIFNDVPYTHEDYDPVILLNREHEMLVVNADAEFDDIESFLEYAGDNPGTSIGVSGAQTSDAFAARDLSEAADLDLTVVPLDGTADAVLQVQGGHLDGVIATYADIESQMREGSMQPILVFAEEQMEDLPEVPTPSDLGLDVANFSAWRGIAAPSGTDPEIIEVLHDVFRETLESEGHQEAMENLNLETEYLGPDDFQAVIDEQYDVYSEYAD